MSWNIIIISWNIVAREGAIGRVTYIRLLIPASAVSDLFHADSGCVSVFGFCSLVSWYGSIMCWNTGRVHDDGGGDFSWLLFSSYNNYEIVSSSIRMHTIDDMYLMIIRCG